VARPDFDVAIAGASFAGLATALAMARSIGSGFKIALFAEASSSGGGGSGRAFALSAGSKALLEALGVWSHIASDAEPILEIDISDTPLDVALRPTVLHYDNTLKDGGAASWVVEANVLYAALRQCVESSAITTRAVRVLGFTSQGDTLSVATDDGQTTRCRLLVAADGPASSVRHMSGIRTVGWPYAQRGLVTIVTHEKPHRGRATQHFLPSGPFAILPMTRQRSSITWTEEEREARRLMEAPETVFLEEAQRRFGYRLGDIALAGARSSFPLSMQLARSYISDRVALVGDAAHTVHPIAGQGLNLGLRDVAALTEITAETARLGLDIGAAPALARYERWRRSDAAAFAAGMDALNRLFSNDWILLRALRDAGLGFVDRLPALKDRFVREAAGTAGDIPKLLRGELA
jgi:2-octaprenyl-6-methoxyphenol hydroxylase